MKKIHLTILLTGLLALSMIGLSACDNMTGVSDQTANQNISSQEVQGVANATVGVIRGVVLDEIGPIQLTEADLPGYIKKITGYADFTTKTENLSSPQPDDYPRLHKVELLIDDVLTGFLENFSNDGKSETIRTTEEGREFAFDWEIDEFDTYKIEIVATFRTDRGRLDENSETDYDEETVVVSEIQVDVEFPAAPAIAARILEANEVSPRWGSGRNGGNYISDVARHMGPGTDFNGVPKELIDEDGKKDMNQAYWDAVWDFLEGAPYYLDLPNKPEGYIW